LLREQTALLAQELRLLREALQEGGLDAWGVSPALESLVPGLESVGKANSLPMDGLSFSDLMADRDSGEPGHRSHEAIDALSRLSKQVVVRRAAGELPLGQVPNMK
ncbi:unnamed protein product, partial [Polarella glacialis]